MSSDRSDKFNFDNFWLSEIRRSGQSEKCRVSCNNFSNDKLIRFDNNRIHRNEDWTSTGATRGRSEESHTQLACLMRKIDE
ncbi:hypothetical protein CRE_14928 [Caenorhabditis remanei]|uniref:Uncharacterized protein n=1 Tax=Caenorhabditis remanei TaxID=31234 RepID=E3N7Q5_CAERE|nr:hypothetical protein CRE_14928 [Caenorhabditis remanei]